MVVGCASWKGRPSSTEPTHEPTNTRIAENKKRVVLEVEFVNLAMDEMDVDQSAAIWQWVDETAVDAAIRQRLLANGLRVGFVASEERFRERLASATTNPDVVESFLSQASVASDVSHGEKRIPMRMGRRYELPLRQPHRGSHVALLRVGGETIGRTLDNPQYLLALTATKADTQEQVRLKIRPEIQFGDTRQKWVSSESALRIDARRETWSIPELDVDVLASERDTIILAPATPVAGLAKQMLIGAGADQQSQQLVVLIRVAQVPSAVDQL